MALDNFSFESGDWSPLLCISYEFGFDWGENFVLIDACFRCRGWKLHGRDGSLQSTELVTICILWMSSKYSSLPTWVRYGELNPW